MFKNIIESILIMLLCAGLVMAADNEATTTQDGENNDALIEQVASGPRSATITQDGDNNKAETRQNYSGYGNSYQTASQYQEGDVNEAYITSGRHSNATQSQVGDENYADIDQGANNTIAATQTQEGDGNHAEITQSIANWTYSNNAQQIQQGNDNKAYTIQTGDDNSAYIFQKGNQNTSEITQDGDYNTASSEIHGHGYVSGKNQSKIEQHGSSNEATQQGLGTGSYFATNKFNIYQSGSDHKAEQTIDGRFGENWANNGSEQTIHQEESNNTASQTMENPGGLARNNKQDISQIGGNDNEAIQIMKDYSGWQYHNGNNNTALISQDGTENFAKQEQFDIDNGYSEINQAGELNHAYTKQNGVNATGSNITINQGLGNQNTVNLEVLNSSVVTIDQIGSENRVEGYDASDTDPATTGNTWASFSGTNMDVDQDGNNNVAEVDASGTVDIDQNGSDHAVAHGSGNIVINQLAHNNKAMTINDNGTTNITQTTNNYNEVWLDKQGTTGSADILQDGNNNKVFGLTGDFGSPTWATFTGSACDLSQTGESNLVKMNANGIVTVTQTGNLNTAVVNQQ